MSSGHASSVYETTAALAFEFAYGNANNIDRRPIN